VFFLFQDVLFVFDFLQFKYDMPRCKFSHMYLLCVLWASWIFALVFVIAFGKFSAIITSLINSFSFLSSPSVIPITYVLHFFVIFPQFLNILLNLITFSVWDISLGILYLFIYLSMAVLGLCCCMQFFLVVTSRELFFVAVRGLLIAVASIAVKHGP